jgi:putative PIN family toxin of toxin-antitoxin system
MSAMRAVMDTNVLHAGLYSAAGASFQVLRMIERRELTPVLSTTLLFEYEEILRRNQKLLHLSNRAIEDVLNGLCCRGALQPVFFLWRPNLADPKDDHVLELAVAAGGVAIVTHNVKHFGSAAAFGIRVLKPAELPRELREER